MEGSYVLPADSTMESAGQAASIPRQILLFANNLVRGLSVVVLLNKRQMRALGMLSFQVNSLSSWEIPNVLVESHKLLVGHLFTL